MRVSIRREMTACAWQIMLLVDTKGPDLIAKADSLQAPELGMESSGNSSRALTKEALAAIPLETLEELLEDVVLNWLELVCLRCSDPNVQREISS
jgi:hypothetical protein